MKQHKYHYFYRIENIINGYYYYGIHSTDNINDKYMGSGHRLKKAIKIYGKENFNKEIIKYFDSREQASDYEALMVKEEQVHDEKCYNVKCGGDYGTTVGTILAKDKEGIFYRVSPNDERYKNGELVNFMTNSVSVFDKNDEKYKIISTDEFYLHRNRYVTYSDGKIMLKDKNGNSIQTSVDDERYKSGELVPIWKGRHHTEETKKKLREIYAEHKHQQGEKNSQYGTVWITKDQENKKVHKYELDNYLKIGWVKGRFVEEDKIKRPSDEIDKDTVIDLYNKYHNWTKIANILGINKTTLLRYRKRHSLMES